MANVVPISQLDKALYNAVAQSLNGLIALKARGVLVECPKEIQISMNVSLDAGINAIPRTTRQTTDNDSVTTVNEPQQKSTTTKGPERSASKTVTDSVKDTTTENSTSGSNQTQGTNFGRSTITTIEYEE